VLTIIVPEFYLGMSFGKVKSGKGLESSIFKIAVGTMVSIEQFICLWMSSIFVSSWTEMAFADSHLHKLQLMLLLTIFLLFVFTYKVLVWQTQTNAFLDLPPLLMSVVISQVPKIWRIFSVKENNCLRHTTYDLGITDLWYYIIKSVCAFIRLIKTIKFFFYTALAT